MARIAQLGTATVHEAAGKQGVIDLALVQVISGSRAAGPARTVLCGQGDNLMVHAAMSVAQPGDVLVVTMPEPAPVAMLGGLLVTQALQRGVAAIIVDGAVRDLDELVKSGLPIWSRWVRVTGASKQVVGQLDVPVRLGGITVLPRDILVLDADGAVAIPAARVDQVVAAATAREQEEARKMIQYRSGMLSYDLLGLRAVVESASPPNSREPG
jgi:4-hydroxy-4-methyl-2-oxoglutarate aldolase